jgi:hypothetical protein
MPMARAREMGKIEIVSLVLKACLADSCLQVIEMIKRIKKSRKDNFLKAFVAIDILDNINEYCEPVQPTKPTSKTAKPTSKTAKPTSNTAEPTSETAKPTSEMIIFKTDIPGANKVPFKLPDTLLEYRDVLSTVFNLDIEKHYFLRTTLETRVNKKEFLEPKYIFNIMETRFKQAALANESLYTFEGVTQTVVLEEFEDVFLLDYDVTPFVFLFEDAISPYTSKSSGQALFNDSKENLTTSKALKSGSESDSEST